MKIVGMPPDIIFQGAGLSCMFYNQGGGEPPWSQQEWGQVDLGFCPSQGPQELSLSLILQSLP